MAKGTYIAFLDSDDWWLPEKLAKSVEALESGADFVYHDLYIVSEGGKKRRKDSLKKARTRNLSAPVFKDLWLKGNGINNSSVVVRRSLLDKAGRISQERDLIAAEDYDFWLRISKISDRFRRLSGCHGYYYKGSDNITSAARTKKYIALLAEIYCGECGICFPGWMSYALAQANLKTANYREARQHALGLIKKFPPNTIAVKALLIFFLVIWRQGMNKWAGLK